MLRANQDFSANFTHEELKKQLMELCHLLGRLCSGYCLQLLAEGDILSSVFPLRRLHDLEIHLTNGEKRRRPQDGSDGQEGEDCVFFTPATPSTILEVEETPKIMPTMPHLWSSIKAKHVQQKQHSKTKTRHVSIFCQTVKSYKMGRAPHVSKLAYTTSDLVASDKVT